MTVGLSVATMYGNVQNVVWLPWQPFKSRTLISWGLFVTTTRRNTELLVHNHLTYILLLTFVFLNFQGRTYSFNTTPHCISGVDLPFAAAKSHPRRQTVVYSVVKCECTTSKSGGFCIPQQSTLQDKGTPHPLQHHFSFSHHIMIKQEACWPI